MMRERRWRMVINPFALLCMTLPFRVVRSGGWGISPGWRYVWVWGFAWIKLHVADIDRIRYRLVAVARQKN